MYEYFWYVVAAVAIMYLFTRVLRIETDSCTVVERKFLFWKRKIVLVRGNNFLVPFLDSVKKDKHGTDICYSPFEMHETIQITTRFNDSTEIHSEIQATFTVKDAEIFLDQNEDDLAVHEFVQEKLKEELENEMNARKPDKLCKASLRDWAIKPHVYMKGTGIHVSKLKIVRQKIVKDVDYVSDENINKLSVWMK